MAEFLIVGVSYSEDEQHIEWVYIARLKDKRLVNSSVVHRSFIVDLIETESASFKTVILNIDHDTRTYTHKIGAPVHVLDKEFLATDRNDTELDNLVNLPRFLMPSKKIEIAVDAMFGPGVDS